jgi:hypothetical protein
MFARTSQCQAYAILLRAEISVKPIVKNLGDNYPVQDWTAGSRAHASKAAISKVRYLCPLVSL